MYILVLVTLVLFLPMAFLVLFSLVPRLRCRRLKRVGIKARGTCVGVAWDSNAATLKVEYVARDGRNYTHRTNPVHMSEIGKGDTVEVVYDPNRPQLARLKDSLEEELDGSFFAGALFVVEGIFLIPQLLWVYLIISGTVHA